MASADVGESTFFSLRTGTETVDDIEESHGRDAGFKEKQEKKCRLLTCSRRARVNENWPSEVAEVQEVSGTEAPSPFSITHHSQRAVIHPRPTWTSNSTLVVTLKSTHRESLRR